MIRRNENAAPDVLSASAIAQEVVNQLFLRLGIDCGNPDDIKALQADFAYLRRARAGSEDMLKVLKRSAITIAIGAAAYAVWEGALRLIGAPPPP